MKTPLLSLIALALTIGCSGPQPDPDPDLTAACQDLCEAQQPCDKIQWTIEECTSACVADVGTPGPDCTAAIEAWGTCAATDCSDTACNDEAAARDNACGGTG